MPNPATLRAQPALHWSSEALASMLCCCFDGYLVPFQLDGAVFAYRFGAENVCLNGKRVAYITQDDVRYIKQGATAAERTTRLQSALDKSSEQEPFEHSLHLRIEKQSLISLDYRSGTVTRTTPMQSKLSSRTVCLVRELRF